MRQDMEFEINDFEQYGRHYSIMIINLATKNNDSTSAVLKLLKDKLQIQVEYVVMGNLRVYHGYFFTISTYIHVYHVNTQCISILDLS